MGRIEEALVKIGIDQKDVSEITEYIPEIVSNYEHNYSLGDLKKIFETLIYIHTAQHIREDGMWRAEKNCPNREILDRLVKFNLIDNTHWQNRSIQTTEEGEKLANIIMGKRINQDRLKEMIDSIPNHISEIIQDYQYLSITFPNVYVQNYGDFPQDFLLSLPRYNEKVYNLCKPFYIKAVKEGWACIAHHYVSTRGGEERGEYYILSPEIMAAIADVIPERLSKDFTQQIGKIKNNMFALKFLYHYNPDTYRGLEHYSQVEDNIMTYLNELKGTIDSSKDLFTNGFSSQMPYMIRDPDAYKTKVLKFERELNKQISDLFSGVDVQKPSKKPSKELETPQSIKPKIPVTSTKLVSSNSDLSILLGHNSNDEDIYWYPKNEKSWNFIIVGSAGTGKTQTVRAILRDFYKNSLPYLIFDFREDYCKDNESQFGQVLDLNSISINPLEIEGKNSPKDQKYQISDIIDLIYNIGPKQIGFIREAIKASYEKEGIYEDKKETWKKSPPTFNNIQDCLKQKAEEGTSPVKNAIQGIFSRLDPIFDYNIFSPNTTIKFEEILKNNTVINLSKLPNENIKSIVCEFFLRKLRYYLYEKGGSRDPVLYVIIDEAHRLKYDKKSSIGQLLKEARKYGVGIVLSTQDPVDFTDLVYNNTGGVLTLQLTDPKYAKIIANHLGGNVDWKFVKNKLSDEFAACVKFSSQDEDIKFKIKPDYKRE